MRILFVINSLNTGGAERMLLKLLKTQQFSHDDIIVVSLMHSCDLKTEFENTKAKIITLGIEKNVYGLIRIFKLFSIVRRFRPDIIHSWLYYSDIIAGLVGLYFKIPVIWGLRQSNLSNQCNKNLTLLCLRICALGSYFLPKKIVSNSNAAKSAHEKIGYNKKIISVIPNGFDLEEFSPKPFARQKIFKKFAIPEDASLVGIVGRFDIQKDHLRFLEVIKYVHSIKPSIYFCFVGEGLTSLNIHLEKSIKFYDIDVTKVHFLGLRKDIPELMASFDLLALPSKGESFPNVLGEAMASETICLANNVGDCSEILGGTGFVSDMNTPSNFGDALLDVLSKPSQYLKQLGKNARQRVKNKYSVEACALEFRKLYMNYIR